MPLTIVEGLLTKANWVVPYLKPLVDSIETAAGAAQKTANDANTLAGGKYSKPAPGIPFEHMDQDAQAQLLNGGAANVRKIEWTGDTTTVRPSADPEICYQWIKRDPAVADPPTDGTYMLAGVDILLRAISA